MTKLWNKHSLLGLHSERNHWLQTGTLADSSELQSEHFFNCVGAGKHRCDFRTYQRALISR